MRRMPSRTITPTSYANAGSYARQLGYAIAYISDCPSQCCSPSPVSVVRPAVAPSRKPRPRWSPNDQMRSPTRWNPNIE